MAHVNLPDWLRDIRIFDVVLLVFVSGIAFSYSKPINSFYDYVLYVWKRIKRLLFVCWIFISFYLLWLFVLNCFGADNALSLKTIFTTYTLIGGVGYVWIIRIYLCMAIIAPWLRYISNKIYKEWFAVLIVAVALALNSLCVWGGSFISNKILDLLVNTCLIPILGYGIVYFIGIRFSKLSLKLRLIYSGLFALILIGSCFIKSFNTIQDNKYPPGVLYLSYGLTVSCILYTAFSYVKKSGKVIRWLSSNSLNIYFCHIFMIAFINFVCLDMNFILFYLIVCVFATSAAAIIYWIKSAIRKKKAVEKKKEC